MSKDFPTGGFELEKHLDLSSDFPITTFEEWKEKVEKDLKGASYDKKLVSRSYEGINLQPIYTKNDLENLKINNFPGSGSFVRGYSNSGYHGEPWDVNQEIIAADASEYNIAILDALNNGQNCVNIPLDSATKFGLDADYAETNHVGDIGLSISAVNSVKRALNDLDLTNLPIYLDAGYNNVPILALLKAYFTANNLDFMLLNGSITADPIAHLATYGKVPVSMDYIFDMIRNSLFWTQKNAPNLKTISVNTLPFMNGGVNAAQELAIALSVLVYYINELGERNVTASDVIKKTHLTFGIGSNYFMEISKFRAARILLNNVASNYNVDEKKTGWKIGAKSTYFTQTNLDPYVNMLRSTTQAFSAILGGINSLTTLPFDETIKDPDSFSRRIARNTQTILREESHLDTVIDAAGGSFYIESLTEELAKKSWTIFQSIEKKGGIFQALKSGYVQKLVDENRLNRKKDIDKRKSVIVGTNMFADIQEKELRKSRLNQSEFQRKRAEYLEKFRLNGTKEKHEKIIELLNSISEKNVKDVIDAITETYLLGSTLGEVSSFLNSAHKENIEIEKISNRRASEDYEELRKSAQAFKDKNGDLPKVYLANYGTLGEYKARADFSKGFFEAGGFKVIESNSSTSIEKIAEEAIRTGAHAAVICSTDDNYPKIVKLLVDGIKSENSQIAVILAGYPKEQIENHKKSGIDDFIFLGANVMDKLSSLLKKIGGEII